MPKAQDLSSIHLHEVSLVDFPANPGAKVTLFKRGHPVSTENHKMTDKLTPDQERRTTLFKSFGFAEELAQILSTLDQAETLEKSFGTMQKTATDAANAAVAKALKASGVVVKFADDGSAEVETTNVDKAEDFIEFEGERIHKSSVPPSVLASITKSNDRIALLEKSARETDLTKRGAADLPNMAGSDLAKGMLLDAVSKLGDTEAQDLLKSLKAADAAVALTMTEKGARADDDPETATSQLKKMADDYAVEKSMTPEAAYLEVTKSGKGLELYKQARTENATQ